MKTFKEQNDKIAETMKTHLINDIDSYGIWNDDYDTFFKKRAEAISKELGKLLIHHVKM